MNTKAEVPPVRYAAGEFVWFVPEWSANYHRVQIIGIEGRSYRVQKRPDMPASVQAHCEEKISFAKAKERLFNDAQRAAIERRRAEQEWTCNAHRAMHTMVEHADFATTSRVAEILGYPLLATPEPSK